MILSSDLIIINHARITPIGYESTSTIGSSVSLHSTRHISGSPSPRISARNTAMVPG